MKKIVFFFYLIISSSVIYAGGKVLNNGKVLYQAGEVIVKIKPGAKISCISDALKRNVLNNTSFSTKKVFPKAAKSTAGLENIYSFCDLQDCDPLYLCGKIQKLAEVEWAEPRFLFETTDTPNDPYLSNQWGLTKIKAGNAWDYSKGDTNVIIGIIDTGVDWDHPDLAAHIWHNWSEIPNNGLDDDGNGYIDDIIGWDFGGLTGAPDNDPMEDAADHGTHVAGIAASVSNNGLGIASISYNCKVMAVKASQNNNRSTTTGKPYIVYGYEAIVYAVNNGCKVINCSWGGYGYSLLGRDVTAYTAEHGALVVAAAGNDDSAEPHYPASYAGVLSVASSSENDVKSSFSNYGTNIDVSAPGDAIYSTWSHDTYIYSSGTSMASPLAAGLAGLIRARYPVLTALQAGERLRIACDDINSVNPTYSRKLGKGRINALKAVSVASLYSIRTYDVQFYEASGNGNGILEPGETVGIKIKFRNMLDPIASMTIGLENTSSYSSIQNGTFSAPAAATLDSFTNYQSPFTFTISSSVPQNCKLDFVINYVNGSFLDFQWISVLVNPSYAIQSSENIDLTVTSKGTLGYNDYPTNLQGNGFRYQNSSSLLFEGALITGISADRISDAARGQANNGNTQNTDFLNITPFQVKIPGTAADIEGMTVFNDNNSGSAKLPITCTLKTYSFSSDADKNFILLRYLFKNTGLASIQSFYAGLFLDWDMTDGNDDITAYDTTGKLGYVHHSGGTPAYFTGAALLNTEPQTGFYGILNAGGDGGIKIYDGFSDAEKWQCISTGLSKTNAGAGDVSFVISGGPMTISAGETKELCFALLGGYSINELRTAALQAGYRYNRILVDVKNESNTSPAEFYLSQNFPNPFNPVTTIKYGLKTDGKVSIVIYDALGRRISSLFNGYKPAGEYEIDWRPSQITSGIYFCRVTAGENVKIIRMIYLK